MNIWIIFISAFINDFAEIYLAHGIVKKGINYKTKKFYYVYIFMVLLTSLNYIFSSNLYKPLITLLIMIIITKLLFNYNIKKNIVISFLMFIITIISELIFSISIVFLKNLDNQTYIQIYQGQIISNIIISFIMILFSKCKFLNFLYTKIYKAVKNISLNKTIIFLGLIVVCSSFLFYISYYNKNNFFSLFVNFLIVTVYFIIVIMIIKKESSYNTIHSKYVIMIDELKEYENIINEYRIINHENKNQLLSIKGMTRNKRLNEYVDEILNNRSSDNKRLLDQALLVPTGGLRGLIYSKLIQMKDKKINYNLNIDRKVNSSLIKNLGSKEMIDICQIIGVFIDNSIEAVEELDEKNIIINIYNEGAFVIEIINNYKSNVKISKIDKAGYTTKGSNHGYGLALVNKLIAKNKNFSNEREVSKNIFKQKLVIKL